MWNRAEMKSRAKWILRGSYWKAFLASLVILFAVGGGGGSGGSGGSGVQFRKEASSLDPAMILWVVITVAGLILIAIAIRILLGFSLEVGGRNYFIRAAEGNADLSSLGRVFQTRSYVPVVLTMLARGVLVALWTLLFIIPGIVKAYAYRLVPYILADNPGIGIRRALELSDSMTRGEKFNLFVLDLSFIGWYLLGSLAFVVGTLFVRPYDDATNAEVYMVLRQRALEQGICCRGELFPAGQA